MKWLLCVIGVLLSSPTFAHTPSDFALRLCKENPGVYKCKKIIIRRQEELYKEWKELYPDPKIRHIIMSINRRNTFVWTGHTIAVPRVLENNILKYSPFPLKRTWFGYRFVVVDLKILAWGAYEAVPGGLEASLVRWGSANGGAKICKETGRKECKTHPGKHLILKLSGPGKRSDLYPQDCSNKASCGHPMPYYMPFHLDGTGLHGDKWSVGRNASHGCVRMFTYDARWMNKKFAFVGMPVFVEDY